MDAATTRQTIEAIASHATRGGWVTISDADGRDWTLLISPGVPIWVSADDDAGDQAPSSR
jgi:hypothetical protein